MKIYLFLRSIIMIACFNSYLQANVVDNVQTSSNNFDFFSKNLLKAHHPFLNRNGGLDQLKEIILGTKNGRALSYDKPYFVLVSSESVKLFKLNENLEVIEKAEIVDLNNFKISAVEVIGNKKLIIGANEENDIFLFDISSGQFKLIDSFLGDGKFATFITVSADGSTLAVLNYSSDIASLYDLTHNTLSKINSIFTGFKSGPLTAMFSEKGDSLGILCDKQNMVKIFSYDENEWRLKQSIEINKDQFFYFADGDTLIIDDKESLGQETPLSDPSLNTVENNEVFTILNSSTIESISTVFDKKIPLTLSSKSRILTRTSRPWIKGRTVPHQKIKIYINDTFLDEVMSNGSGNFFFRVKNSLANGSYTFNAQIQAGQINVRSNYVNFRINKHYLLKSVSSIRR